MQLLGRLVGPGSMSEAEALLHVALESGASRVVVKRADDGPILPRPGGEPPQLSFKGRTVRFDVYLQATGP